MCSPDRQTDGSPTPLVEDKLMLKARFVSKRDRVADEGWTHAASSLRFLDHTRGRTPLNEGSASRTDLYPTTHNINKRQTSMSSAGFEPATASSQRDRKQVPWHKDIHDERLEEKADTQLQQTCWKAVN